MLLADQQIEDPGRYILHDAELMTWLGFKELVKRRRGKLDFGPIESLPHQASRLLPHLVGSIGPLDNITLDRSTTG